jgi:hypothetical protein
MEQLVAFGSAEYWGLFFALLWARGMDFFSTWLATPNLVLEANPIARRIGWRAGLVVNAILITAVAVWPLPSIVIATMSVLVAARNFQSAWLMRSMGEESYRCWIVERVKEARGLYMFCIGAHSLLAGSIGGLLIFYSQCTLEPALLHVVPFAVGVGIVTYALAVLTYTWFSLRRIRERFS